MNARRRPPALLLASLLAISIALVSAPERASSEAPRLAKPEDRYAMAGGCYTIKSLATDTYIGRDSGVTANASTIEGAQRFHFQATDLGRYLLFGKEQYFLAASDGVVGGITDTLKAQGPLQMADGASTGKLEPALDALGEGPLSDATGRGAEVVLAATASELSDWEIREVGGEAFTIRLPATTQALSVDGAGALVLVEQLDAGSLFAFELTDGCAAFPEVEVNIDGPVLGGDTSFEEVRGFIDAHLHMMAYEFIGGRVRCGRPWHRFGVAHALVDCSDHEPGGQGAVLEAALGGSGPGGGHDTVGWPTFGYWPKYNSLTHEQVYYKWLERAWRGGLRMFTNLLVDNFQLCRLYPYKRNSCNEMDGVRLQARRLRELERYIDAQSGGPGEGWFRIVTDPFQARRVINQGKLAVVMGIEVSVPLDCGLLHDQPLCDTDQIDAQLDAVYDMGVRQMELVNKFDNALSGVTGDAGTTGIVTNTGNLGETGRFLQLETCDHQDPHWQDKRQMNVVDDGGAPEEFAGRDSIFGAVLSVSGASGAAPIYGEGPHCNLRGLSPLGEHMIRRMIDKGMLFDPDHMSATARRQALDLIEEAGYSGVVSSHSWADDTIYQRVYELGGVVTPYAGGSTGFVEKWREHRTWADERFLFGFGYGADANGFGAQGAPRGATVPNPVTYPFTGFGGVTVHQQVSGERTYDINTDGVAHYGLYPDWIQDLQMIAGDDAGELMADMVRGPEAYLQMWERAIGVAPNACRADVGDLTDDQIDALEVGMMPEAVLAILGQPDAREDSTFEYCMTGNRRAAVTFNGAGSLGSISVS